MSKLTTFLQKVISFKKDVQLKEKGGGNAQSQYDRFQEQGIM